MLHLSGTQSANAFCVFFQSDSDSVITCRKSSAELFAWLESVEWKESALFDITKGTESSLLVTTTQPGVLMFSCLRPNWFSNPCPTTYRLQQDIKTPLFLLEAVNRVLNMQFFCIVFFFFWIYMNLTTHFWYLNLTKFKSCVKCTKRSTCNRGSNGGTGASLRPRDDVVPSAAAEPHHILTQ